MLEPKDPAIKLFGKTIPLPEISQGDISTSTRVCGVGGGSQDQDRQSCGDPAVPDEITERGDEEERESDNKDSVGEKATKGKPQDMGQNATLVERSNSEGTSVTTESAKTPSAEKESTELKTSKTEEEQSDTSNMQEKTPKKPDTVLPCPRCNSMDTKFCYYNNYNVNQPRHYCKNCQRYWTAGGTMRNVPVGAGRRKNKNSASHYRHVTVSEALQNGQSDVPNGVHHPILKTNSTVVAFGADTPLHESMASALNLTDKTMQNCTRNGFLKPEALSLSVSHGNQDNHSNVSAVPTSGSNGEACKSGSQEPVVGNCQGFPPQLACFPGTTWPYPWDTAQWSPTVTPPAFYPPGFAVPFYPAAACWGSTVPGSWNIPWLPQPCSPKQTAANSGPNSPTLGKHLRDENMPKSSNSVGEESVKDNNSERCLWIPKTLRIGDPREAAKSSILTSLGIKNDKAEAIGGQGLLKAFQSKGNGKICMTETSSILQANPAALSRSLQFHESS